jgi:hypothetical protein
MPPWICLLVYDMTSLDWCLWIFSWYYRRKYMFRTPINCIKCLKHRTTKPHPYILAVLTYREIRCSNSLFVYPLLFKLYCCTGRTNWRQFCSSHQHHPSWLDLNRPVSAYCPFFYHNKKYPNFAKFVFFVIRKTLAFAHSVHLRCVQYIKFCKRWS